MVATNTLLLERKQALRKKMGVAFAKNPEITDEMMDFLDALVAQISDEAQATHENQRVQNKHEIREELSKELVSKQDLLLTKADLQAEIQEVRGEIQEVRAEIQQVESSLRTEINRVETSLRAEIKLSNLKTSFQTALIVLVVLLTTPGGTHLLEKVFSFLR